MKVAIDSSVLVALLDPRDIWRDQSLACRERDVPATASFDADFDQMDWLRRIAAPDDLPNG